MPTQWIRTSFARCRGGVADLRGMEAFLVVGNPLSQSASTQQRMHALMSRITKHLMPPTWPASNFVTR